MLPQQLLQLHAPDYDLDPRRRDPRLFGHSPLRSAVGYTRSLVRGQRIPRPGLQRFIDASLHNQLSPSALFAGGVTMAAFRISMGISGFDATGLQYAIDFHNAGGLSIGYHLFLAEYDGTQQANNYLNRAAPLLELMDGKGAVMQDQETPGATNMLRRSRSESFCWRINDETSLLNGIYTNTSLANTWGFNQAWVQDAYDLFWQAEWSAYDPTQIAYWPNKNDSVQKKKYMRQSGVYNNYWWEDPVIGVSSDIDIDWYYGTQIDLQQMMGIVALPPTLEQRVSVLELEARAHGWNV